MIRVGLGDVGLGSGLGSALAMALASVGLLVLVSLLGLVFFGIFSQYCGVGLGVG